MQAPRLVVVVNRHRGLMVIALLLAHPTLLFSFTVLISLEQKSMHEKRCVTSLNAILSYFFFPVVWLMGVEPSQCLKIARLIGIKVSVNEFVAYVQLGELTKTGILSPRTQAIATYALCSFANPGSVGILVSTLTTLCPPQRYNIIAVSTRAFMSAVVVSFLTASIAGVLMPEEGFTD